MYTVPAVYAQNSTTNQDNEKKLISLHDVLNVKSLIPALITASIVAMVLQGVIPSGLGPVAKEHFGESVFILGLAVGCASLSGFLQALRWCAEPFLAHRCGRASDKSSSRFLYLSWSLFAGAMLFALVAYIHSIFAWIIVVVFLEGCAIALNTLPDAVITEIAQKSGRQMSVLTVYSLITDFGAALGPLFLFEIGRLYSFSTVYMLVSAILLTLGIYWIVKVRKI